MRVQGTTSMGQLILQWGGQEWEAPEGWLGGCWVRAGFTEEVTFKDTLEERCKLANWIKEGRAFQVEGNFAKP